MNLNVFVFLSYQLYGLKKLASPSVITFYNIGPNKMTDDKNSQKMLVDRTHIVDIEFWR